MLSSKQIFEIIPVNVIFSICGQVVVDDERDLLDIDTTGQQVGGDQDSGRSGPELAHDHITFLLVHVSVLKRKNYYENVAMYVKLVCYG